MHHEIQETAVFFHFICDEFGGRILDSYYDDENFGNFIITYQVQGVVINIVRDRDQISVGFKKNLASEEEVGLVKLLTDSGLIGDCRPESFYGLNGARITRDALRDNFMKIVEVFGETTSI